MLLRFSGTPCRGAVFGLACTLVTSVFLAHPLAAQESPTTGSAPPRTTPAPSRATAITPATGAATEGAAADEHRGTQVDYWSMLFVLALSTFIGVGVIRRVSRLLHTPLMSITNAISAIAVVGAIIVAGADHPNYPMGIRILGAIALFASMTNIVSGFLITDRMLKMFKQPGQGGRKA